MCSAIVPIRRAKQLSRLGPRRLLEGVTAPVGEEAELVASRAAVAGREGEERLAVVVQWRGPLVDAEPVDLPGLEGQGELVAGADATGGVERGYAEALQVAGDARPDEVVLVVQGEDRAVYAEFVGRQGREECVVVPR